MRSRKAFINVITALILQLTSIICGLIVPRAIINSFGSSVNGLISSISQFLTYIVLLEAGVGGVVRAALYKSLANNDVLSVSKIIKATDKFFKKIAYIFIIYLFALSFMLPFIVINEFDFLFTFSLVLIIGVSTFFQYYFGISYQILLQADQRQYTNTVIQIMTIVINTILIVVLVNIGSNIQNVKILSALIFVIRPILLNVFVNKKYKIVKNCEADTDSISQRWDGFGHHIAFFVMNSTDIVILTFLTNIKEVSVYSVYFMIIGSIKNLAITFSSGLEAAFGNIIARDEKEALQRNFKIYEFFSFSITTILFTTTAISILPFVSLYTSGISDANYYRPLFSIILVIAYAIYSIRTPYSSLVLAAGHYKETRNGAFAEAIINIIVSLILVNYFGIVGVAFGTLFAIFFRTFQYVHYLSKNVIKRESKEFVVKFLIYSSISVSIYMFYKFSIVIDIKSYLQWFYYAFGVFLSTFLVTIAVGFVFYSNEINSIYLILRRIFNFK